MQRLVKCLSSRVQIKDSGLTYGADDETDHHFLLSKYRLGALEEIIIKRNAFIQYLFSGLISADLSITRVESKSAHGILC